MSAKRSHILTIAGFDPSGGAGVLADIKTFEQHRLVGMAVNTANTVQNDTGFDAVNPESEARIMEQLDALLRRFSFSTVKIGLMPHPELIPVIAGRLGNKARIVWDPVLSASAGTDFNISLNALEKILTVVHIVTPNWEEVVRMTGIADAMEAGRALSGQCNVYLKGGHRAEKTGHDALWLKGKEFSLAPGRTAVWPKHGSGCILSSALASHVEKGYPMLKACLRAKRYTEAALGSNRTLLAYHKA